MKDETKEDARKISSSELKGRCHQVIRAHKRGVNQMQISRDIGLHYQTVRGIIRRFKEGGIATITPRVRGRKAETQRLLIPEQESEIKIKRLICEKRPEQLKMEFALWNRAAVKQWIAQEFGVELGVRTGGDYWGADTLGR